MTKLLGAVLCGGQSKRMGKDKGLLQRNQQYWAAIVADKLRAAGLQTVVSINPSQATAYSEIFPEEVLVTDNLEIGGPLAGLLSVHRAYPDRDIFLMACDLVDMDLRTLSDLIYRYNSDDTFDYYVYTLKGFTQPFCAIYTTKALKKEYEKFEQHELKNLSLHQRFESGNTLYLPAEDEKSFNNYNSPESIRAQQ